MAKDSRKQQLYLKSLEIQNLATFQQQKIEFSHDFNAIIGETGSGKSLILDAIHLIFGGRADKSLIRKGASFAMIEAVFKTNGPAMYDYLDSLGYPFENDEVIVKRILYKNGSNKSFLNLGLCSLQILNKFSRRYIDLIGQFENQKLQNEMYQLMLLDTFSGLDEKIKKFRKAYLKMMEIEKLLSSLYEKNNLKVKKMDYLEFQIKEIETLSPSIDNERSLIEKKEELLNKARKREKMQYILQKISGESEANILSVLKKIVDDCNTKEIINSSLLSKLQDAYHYLEEISYSISKEIEDEDSDESQIDEVLDLLDRYQKLKRKFGGDVGIILEEYKEMKDEINSLKNIEKDIENKKEVISKIKKEVWDLANLMHKIRAEKAIILSTEITSCSRSLKMENASLEFKIEKLEKLTINGITKLNFIAELNPGEGFHEVKKMASGGELSRILLALRQVLSSRDTISIFFFDEIDVGISGETAVCVGKALKKISSGPQVITVTHLPQMANYANSLIVVSKQSAYSSEGKERTYSLAQRVVGASKIKYVEKMASTEIFTMQ